MFTLGTILPAENPALHSASGSPEPASGAGQSDEQFDQLMTRTLSRPVNSRAGKTKQPDSPASGKRNHSSATSNERQPIQDPTTATPNPAPAAVDASIQPVETSSSVPDSDHAPANASPVTGGNQSDAVLLAGGLSTLISTLPVAAATTSTSSPTAASTVAAHSGVFPPQTREEAQSTLNRRTEPEKTMETSTGSKATIAGKADVNDSATVHALASDLKVLEQPAKDTAEIAPMVKPALESLEKEAFPFAKADTEIPGFSPSDPDGIPAAKLYLSMNKTEKMNNFAGLAEKVLPHGDESVAAEKILPVDDLPARASSGNGASVTLMGPATTDVEPQAATAAANVSGVPAADLRSGMLDRVHDTIALHGTCLIDAQSDFLRIIVKPDSGTQLSLELRHRGETVDAHVILERGDFGVLNQHWPELQQRLEQHGIRLDSLVSGESSFGDTGNPGFQQPRQAFPEMDPVSAGAFAEFAVAQSTIHPTQSSVVSATAHRSWETWA